VEIRQSKKPYACEREYAWQKVSKVSLARGLIPNICPICKNPPFVDDGKFLVIHHWGPLTNTKLECIEGGMYRRMCYSCNAYLGKNLPLLSWLYTKNADWEGQYVVLSERCRSQKKYYPNFDEVEGEWSKFLPAEYRVYEELLKE